MPNPPGGSPKARNLGAELRTLREAVDVSTRALAQKLGIARSRIQRWEAGSTVPTPAEVSSYLSHLHITGDEHDRMLQLAAEVDGGNWTTSDETAGAHAELTTLIEFERTCTEIFNVAPMLVPGLLQTADYTRAVMGKLPDVENRVQLRLNRQNILTKKRNAPSYSVVLSEGALREPIGGPAVMAAQLRHIVDTTKAHDNITVRVIPSGLREVHPAHAGMFVLFRFPKASPIVHLEHYGPATFLYNAKDVAAYERAEQILRTVAMNESDSCALMAEVATEMEQEEG